MIEMTGIADRVEDAVREGLRRLWEEERALHEWSPGSYYPSYVGYCLRKQYYIYELGERPTSEKLAIFATGRGVHKAVEEALRASGIVDVEDVEKEVEVKLTDDISLSGRVDLLLAEVEGERVIVEVKSTSRLPESPLEHHMMQIQVYLKAEHMDRGILLYWDKRRGEIRAFKVERSEDLLRRIAERVVVLHEYIRRGSPPPKEAVLEGRLWECDLCEYRDRCKPFLLPGIPEGERILISEVDKVLVDDSGREREALALAGVPGVEVEELSPEVRRRFYGYYYSADLLGHDVRGPFVEYVWRRRAEGVKLVVVSGRPEGLREETIEELRRLGLTWDHIMLRPKGEREVGWKINTYRRLAEHYSIEEVLDRNRAAQRAARRLGAKTILEV